MTPKGTGILPTDKSFKVQSIDMVEVHDGKFTAHRGVMDQAAMMEQLGLAPELIPPRKRD